MKFTTIIIKSFMLISNIFICFFSSAQVDRPVAWVHGLGEDQETWDIYHNLFDAQRKIDGSSRFYPSSINPVSSFADGVKDGIMSDFPGTTGPSTQNIGIGHSLGGLAVRELDRTFTGTNKQLGGLITIGSPNDGGHIVNSIRNGDVTDAANNACERLSAGPLSEIPFLAIEIRGIANDVICRILADEVLDEMFQNEANGLAEDDVETGSAFLTTLNSNSPNIPAISIRGNENSPVHWRMLSSFDTENVDDEKFVEIANLMRDLYNGIHTIHVAGAVVYGIVGIFNPLLWIKAAVHAWKAIEWNKGKKWFDQSENIWNGLIDCNPEEEEVTITQITGVNCNWFGPTGSHVWILCIMNHCGGNINNCWHTETITTTIFVNNSSDGLFCDETQLIDGIPSTNYYEAKGVNHSEEINTTHGTTDDGTDVVQTTFNAIWNRVDVFGIPLR